jgi:hypothetical protein
MANLVKGTVSMKSVTAVRYVVVLSVLLGLSSGVRAIFVLLVDPATGNVVSARRGRSVSERIPRFTEFLLGCGWLKITLAVMGFHRCARVC